MNQFLLGFFASLPAVWLGAFLYNHYTENRDLKNKKIDNLQEIIRILNILTSYATILTQEHYQCNYFRKANQLDHGDPKTWEMLVKHVDEVSEISGKMIEYKGELSKNLFLYKRLFGKDDVLFTLMEKVTWNDTDKFEYIQHIPDMATLSRIHLENMKNVHSLIKQTVGSKVKDIEGHLEQKALKV